MTHLSEDVRSAIRLFAFSVGNGSLELRLLDGIDYRPAVMEFGSDLERVFAIFSNVLDVDDAGQVTNVDQGSWRAAQASWRAAQWIRASLDPEYTVQPPFQNWEFELV